MNIAPGGEATRSVAIWVEQGISAGSNPATEISRLEGLGFVGGLAENLVTPGNADRGGLSAVEEFNSTRGPTAEVANATVQNGPWVKFAVPGIANAVGFEQTGPDGGGRNVGFADGSYYYVVGDGWKSMRDAVPRDKLIAAALLLYRKVHELPGG